MGYRVEIRVLSGPLGPRQRAAGSEIFIRGETIQFFLANQDIPADLYRLAQLGGNWSAQNPFTLVIQPQLPPEVQERLESRASRVQALPTIVRASTSEPLYVRHRFTERGLYRLSFGGTSRMVYPRSEGSMSRDPDAGHPMFPSVILPSQQIFVAENVDEYHTIDTMTAVEVPLAQQSRGRVLATRTGPYSRVAQEHERITTELEQWATRARQERLAQLRAARGGAQRGLFVFQFANQEALDAMRPSEFQDYINRMNDAIHATPPIDLRTNEDRWFQRRVRLNWHVTSAPDNRIEIYQSAYFFLPPAQRTLENLEILRRLSRDVRRSTQLFFDREDWLVVIQNPTHRRILIRAQDLLNQERLAALMSVVSTVMFLVDVFTLGPLALQACLVGRCLLAAVRRAAASGIRAGGRRAAVSELAHAAPQLARTGARASNRATVDRGISSAADRGLHRAAIPDRPPRRLHTPEPNVEDASRIAQETSETSAARYASMLNDAILEAGGTTGRTPLTYAGREEYYRMYRSAVRDAMEQVRVWQQWAFNRMGGRPPQEYGRWMHLAFARLVRSGDVSLPAGFRLSVVEESFGALAGRYQLPDQILNMTVHSFLRNHMPRRYTRSLIREYSPTTLVRELTPDLLVDDGLGNLIVIDLTSRSAAVHRAKSALYARILDRGGRINNVEALEIYYRTSASQPAVSTELLR